MKVWQSLFALPDRSPHTPTSAAAETRAQLIAGEQVQLLYAQGTIAIMASVVAALLLVYRLWETAPTSTLLVWLAGLGFTLGVRTCLIFAYYRRRTQTQNIKAWQWSYVLAVTLTGWSWLSTDLFLTPLSSPQHRVFLIFIAAILASGSLTSLLAVRSAFLGFNTPLLTLLFLQVIALSPKPLVTATAVCVFIAAFLHMAKRLRTSLLESLQIRFDNLDLLQNLQNISDAALDSIITLDQTGAITVMNPAAEQTFGYSREQTLGQPFVDLMSPSVLQAQHRRILAQLFTGEETSIVGKRIETMARRANGEEFPIELTITLTQHSGSSFSTLYIRDITGRRKSEEEIKRRDALLQGVATATVQLLTVNDYESSVTLALETLGRAVEVDRVYIFKNHIDPLNGQLLTSQRFEWARAAVAPQINNPDLQNIPYNHGFAYWRPLLETGLPVKGLTRDFPPATRLALEAQSIRSLLAVPINVSGQWWGFIGFDDCHTERIWNTNEVSILTTLAQSLSGAIARQRAERTLQTQLQFETIIATLSKHFINLDAQHIDQEITQALQTISRFLHVDRSYIFLFSQDGARMSNTHEWCASGIASHCKRLQDVPTTAFSWSVATYQRLEVLCLPNLTNLPPEATGERHEFQLADVRSFLGVPMTAGGQLLGFLGLNSVQQEKFWTDESITLLKVIAEIFANALARRQIERLKDELVSTVSHELRTPLTSLRGFAELMLKRSFSPEKQKEFLSVIHKEATRLTELINDFLDIQRIESGKQTYHFEELNIAPLFRDVVTVFMSTTEHHTFQLEIDEQLPKVQADSARVHQVLANLLSNALKFSPQGGQIRIGARQEHEHLTVWVADDGIGIPPEVMPRLFSKFFRVDNKETRTIGGTGLGLALVKDTIEAHGGQVWVESVLGHSSTFFFTLPLINSTKAAIPASQEAA